MSNVIIRVCGEKEKRIYYHDAADSADADTIIRLKESTSADLKGEGWNQAADNLGRIVRNCGRIDWKYNNVYNEQS